MNVYTLIRFVHVLLAILAVGLLSYATWILRAAQEPAHLDHVLRGFKTLDDRFANPGYLLLFVTGLSMVFVENLALTTFWVAAAILLWLTAIAIGFLMYTPTLRRRIERLEQQGADSPAFQRTSQRGSVLGIILAVIVVMIVFLMIVKPGA